MRYDQQQSALADHKDLPEKRIILQEVGNTC